MILEVRLVRLGKESLAARRGRRVWYYVPVLLAALSVGCATAATEGAVKCVSQNSLRAVDKPSTVQLGNIILVDKASRAPAAKKVLVAAFQFGTDKFGNDEIKSKELIVAFGTGNIPFSQQCDFWFELVDAKNNVLARYGISDPRELIVDDPTKQQKGGLLKVKTAEFAARFPFTTDAEKIRVLDAQEQPVASTTVPPAIYKFCTVHEKDPDCRGVKRR